MSGVELVWTRTHAVLTTAIASVAVSTWLFQSGGTIVASVREGVAREPARLVGALSSLADYVHGTYGISGSIVRGVLFSAVLVGAVWGYMHVSNLVQAQLQRKKVSIAQFLTHAKNFRHAHNGEMPPRFHASCPAVRGVPPRPLGCASLRQGTPAVFALLLLLRSIESLPTHRLPSTACCLQPQVRCRPSTPHSTRC